MTAIEWVVVAIGIALIALINWYFFFSTGAESGERASGAHVHH